MYSWPSRVQAIRRRRYRHPGYQAYSLLLQALEASDPSFRGALTICDDQTVHPVTAARPATRRGDLSSLPPARPFTLRITALDGDTLRPCPRPLVSLPADHPSALNRRRWPHQG